MIGTLDETLHGALDGLSETVLPFVLARLGRAARRLRELSTLLEESPLALRDGSSLAAVEEARAETDRLGWCLGVLAAARGSDLLLERRERAGLRQVVEVVCAALGDRTLDPPAAALPELAGRSGQSWELPLLLGWSVFAVAREQTGPIRWNCSGSSQSACFSLVLAGMERERRQQLAEQWKKLCQLISPPCTAGLESDRLLLTFPAAWLEGGAG